MTYAPDVTNNPLHGYEFYKFPTKFQVPGVAGFIDTAGTNPQLLGGYNAPSRSRVQTH